MGLSASVFKNCFGEKRTTEMQLRIYLAFTEQLMFSWAVQRHLSGVPQGWSYMICNWATIRRRNWMWFNIFKHNFTNNLLGLHLDDPNVNIFPSGWRNSSPGLQCNGCNIFDLMSHEKELAVVSLSCSHTNWTQTRGLPRLAGLEQSWRRPAVFGTVPGTGGGQSVTTGFGHHQKGLGKPSAPALIL